MRKRILGLVGLITIYSEILHWIGSKNWLPPTIDIKLKSNIPFFASMCRPVYPENIRNLDENDIKIATSKPWPPDCLIGLEEIMNIMYTVNFLNIRTPKKIVVITLKFELWLSHRVMSPNDADGMANSVDPDQTAPLGVGSLIWVCTVCPGISVRKLGIITVFLFLGRDCK